MRIIAETVLSWVQLLIAAFVPVAAYTAMLFALGWGAEIHWTPPSLAAAAVLALVMGWVQDALGRAFFAQGPIVPVALGVSTLWALVLFGDREPLALLAPLRPEAPFLFDGAAAAYASLAGLVALILWLGRRFSGLKRWRARRGTRRNRGPSGAS